MRRRRLDVDWYVDMSERLERREARRKWVYLAIFVSVSLVLILGGSAFIWVQSKHPEWLDFIGLSRGVLTPPPVRKKAPEALGPLVVASLESGDLKYSQLDGNGFPTTITHYFREFACELPPETEGGAMRSGFRLNRTDESSGTVEVYRLRNIGTGEQHEFKEVAAKRVGTGDEWAITDEGHRLIHQTLQAKMRVQLSKALR
jgi:hypothetical protein